MGRICYGTAAANCGTVLLSMFMVAAADLAWGHEVLGRRAASTLPDLSGLAWVEDDTFLAVHDAKNPEEIERPRVSVVVLPTSLEGITWQPVDLAWPSLQGSSSDLESVARVPGTSSLLLVESGEGQAEGQAFRRIFLVEYHGEKLILADVADWPVEVGNVEGTAVARVGERLIFLFAERNQDEPSTQIRWAEFQQDPITFGPFQSITFQPPGEAGEINRPLVGLDVDDAGQIYAVSAFDSGDDNGPFRSVVWRIGQIKANTSEVQIMLDEVPHRIATLDGMKVESVTVREGDAADQTQIFIGTDDENFGGTLRLLPPS